MLLQRQTDRAVIRSHHVGINLRRRDAIPQIRRGEKVIDPPADIALARVGPIRPVGVDGGLIGMQSRERCRYSRVRPPDRSRRVLPAKSRSCSDFPSVERDRSRGGRCSRRRRKSRIVPRRVAVRTLQKSGFVGHLERHALVLLPAVREVRTDQHKIPEIRPGWCALPRRSPRSPGRSGRRAARFWYRSPRRCSPF